MNVWWKWGVLGAVVLIVGWGLWSLMSARNDLTRQVSDLTAQISKLNGENRDLMDQIDYYKNPDNLVNKLKEQTSYRFQDEKLIIITSGATSTESTSTTTSTK